MLNSISDLPMDDHELCGDGGLIMPTTDIQKTQEILEQAFATFAVEHPDVAEAMRTMNISFQEYLEALARLKETSSSSGNASTQL